MAATRLEPMRGQHSGAAILDRIRRIAERAEDRVLEETPKVIPFRDPGEEG